MTLLLGLVLAALAFYRASELRRHPGEASAWSEHRFFAWARGDLVETAQRAFREIEAQLVPGEPVTVLVPGSDPRDLRWWLTLALYHLPEQPPAVVLADDGGAPPPQAARLFRITRTGGVVPLATDTPRTDAPLPLADASR